MLRFVAIAGCLMVSGCLAHAQLKPPAYSARPVEDPSMIVNDRGSQLEVIPGKRATATTDSGGRVTHQLLASVPSAALGPNTLGVVFNHSMQAEGFITGEIAFALKAGARADETSFPHAAYPGLAKVTNPNVFLVKANTPAAFISLLKLLQGRTDLEWVEPTVLYETRGGALAR